MNPCLLSEREWAQLRLLPRRAHISRPPKDHRLVLEGYAVKPFDPRLPAVDEMSQSSSPELL
jgi:hypothetical protein